MKKEVSRISIVGNCISRNLSLIKNILNNINSELKSNYNSIEEIIDQRNSARADKNWEMADQIRIVLDKYGIVLKDSKEGTIWETKA